MARSHRLDYHGLWLAHERRVIIKDGSLVPAGLFISLWLALGDLGYLTSRLARYNWVIVWSGSLNTLGLSR